MGLKSLQAMRALAELVRAPFDFGAAVRLTDALGGWGPLRWQYERMLKGLTPAQREHLRELTLRAYPSEELARLPPSTLGAQYAAFLRRSRLSDNTQAEVFPPIQELFREHWLILRFTRVHDLHHVLMGFEVNLPEELGLQIFNVRNFGEPFGLLALLGTPWIIARYGQAPRMIEEAWRGWRLGGQVENLFQAPLEDWFDRDVSEVRRMLRIPEPASTGRAG